MFHVTKRGILSEKYLVPLIISVILSRICQHGTSRKRGDATKRQDESTYRHRRQRQFVIIGLRQIVTGQNATGTRPRGTLTPTPDQTTLVLLETLMNYRQYLLVYPSENAHNLRCKCIPPMGKQSNKLKTPTTV